MRLYQLFENGEPSMEATEMYEYLKTKCPKFYELSEGFKYVPHRELSVKYGTPAPHNLALFKTRPTRKSVLYYSSNIMEYYDKVSTMKGNASRIKHMMSASSLGSNSQFPVNRFSPHVFPIGDFTYSYIDDDFNLHTDDFDSDVTKLLGHIIESPELEKVGLDKVFHTEETTLKFYNHIKGTLVDPVQDEHIESTISTIFYPLDETYNTDYIDAFRSEHEIWFNCKEYFLLPMTEYAWMMERKQ